MISDIKEIISNLSDLNKRGARVVLSVAADIELPTGWLSGTPSYEAVAFS